MYLEIDEGYFEHPKTLDLCARLGDPMACVYPLRLWKWACRSAKSGRLGKISAFAIEKAVDYEPRDGKCFTAMCSTSDRGGFIDVAEDGTAEIHDWMDYTGGAIARMDAKVKANKNRRDAARNKHDAGTMLELCGNDAGRNPTKTRPDQTSPDKTSQDKSIGDPEPPAFAVHEFLFRMKIAMEREQPQVSPWNAGPWGNSDARKFLEAFGEDLKKAVPNILQRIDLFAKDPAMSPWTVAKFFDKYNGIGQIKAESQRPNQPAPFRWPDLPIPGEKP